MNTIEFERQKRESLSHVLIKVGRLLNSQGLKLARQNLNLPELKQSYLDLFPHIDFEGTTISEIARRKGVSKQAASKLVHEMVGMNLLYFAENPEDSRSKKVFFYTKGPFAIQEGFKSLEALDLELHNVLGEQHYKQTLQNIIQVLENFS